MKLIIAEKPSVARDIAAIVGANKNESGFLSGSGYYVSWCLGHLIENAEPSQYDARLKAWRMDTLPIIPAIWRTSVLQKTAKQFQTLERLMAAKETDGIICAGDCGREGELIFRMVYNHAECKKPVQRLWISSLEESEIRRGLSELKDGADFDNLYHAALCRSRADWLVGMNLSRLYSILSGRALRVGRVQTPTVAMIAQRQSDIDCFTPRPYWQLAADVGGWKAYATVGDHAAAEAIMQRCNHKSAQLTCLTQDQKTVAPPRLFNITSLQREANRLLGYTAQQTLTYMQSLYEKKLVSYPRTDSEYLPSNMLDGLPGRLQQILRLSCVSEGVRSSRYYQTVNFPCVIDDKKITDHHAIIPTGQDSDVPDGERNIFLLVIYRFLAALAPAYHYKKTTAVLTIEGEKFKATGITVVTDGFQAVLEDLRHRLKGIDEDTDAADTDEKIPAGLQEGITVTEKAEIRLIEKATQPPRPYTDATLLAAMANAGSKMQEERLKEAMKGLGLGTGATRAAVIEGIIKSGYVIRAGKKLLPTEMAAVLLQTVSPSLQQAEMTAEWENKLEQIATGAMNPDVFMAEITDYVRNLVNTAKKTQPDLTCFSLLKSKQEPVGICPRCGQNVFETPKTFICESGKDGCGFVLWKENRFFTAKKKMLTKQIATALLESGRVKLTGCYSEKTGKTYDAFVILEDTNGTVNFGLEFLTKKPMEGNEK